ncbi:zinc ABC transporter substrate-binding protein [Rhodobacter sp. TJ_12]|uniref:zinc ABC transporter substrate-binding protein n=1 Tax=Rhodobacter sp. TJ_12 TaxID=2029399 RepID=UPI001CBAC310|nr:zinc ABC transporter substrate-binding protein [Rhodobacter sp. TJ_12]MBZ4021893.1 zinc ABC transporter substrate-binding protein [Rhodobacter sp. TJ_12]
MNKTLIPALALLPLPALAEVPQVVTDIPAVHALTAQVMGDLGRPAVLLEQGASAHHYQLKPSQAATLQEADLVFWVGPELTPWLERAIDGLALGSKPVELLGAPGTHLQDFDGHEIHHDAEDGHDDDDHAAHEHAEEDHAAAADDDHDHVHEGMDPHAWLTPENAETWLGVIAQELAATDPDHAATYAANAAAAQDAVRALDTKLQAMLAPVAGKPFVTFHAAYGYFTAHYGLDVVGAVNLGDASAPGAAHLSALRADLAQKNVVCAFPEAQHDPKQIDILLDGTSVKRGAVLDPSGSALDYGPGLYTALMTDLATALVDCLAP